MKPLVIACTCLAACGGNGTHANADAKPIDAKADAPVDSGVCGAGATQFTGEYVDWGSTTTQFCGIFGASLQVHGSSTVDMTPPNGRFKLCVPATGRTQIDITLPSGASPCSPSPGSYSTTMRGIAIADPAVIATGQIVSMRDFTTAVAAGLSLNANDAQLFVHVDGSASAINLSEATGTPQYFDGSAWSTTPPSTIVNVFYPNLDPTPGSVTVSMTGATGNGSVPIQAGAMSYLTLVVP